MADPIELPEHLRESAFAQYGETTEKRRAAIDELRSRILTLPEVNRLNDLSDANLIRFIRCRKYDLTRALETTCKLKQFYTKHAKLLIGLDGEFLESIFHHGIVRVSKNVDTNSNRTVVVFRPEILMRHLDDAFYAANPNFFLRLNVWLMDRLSRDADVQVNGMVLLGTFAEMGFFDVVRFANLMTIAERSLMFSHMSTLGIRVKCINLFEAPMVIQGVLALLKPFLSSKIRDRLNLYGADYEGVLVELIGKEGWERMPACFGGQSGENINMNESIDAALKERLIWNP